MSPHAATAPLLFGLAWLLLGAPIQAAAHAGPDERLHAIEHRIEESPGDANLYVRRANLYREQADWEAALADYARAERLSPNLEEIAFHRGLLWLARGDADEACRSLEMFLTMQPRSSAGHAALAEAMRISGSMRKAERAYDLAIRYARNPQPDLFLARARLLLGTKPPELERALEGLAQGIETVGPAPALIEASISAQLRAGHPDLALEQVEKLPQMLQKTPKWLALRGELLVIAGKRDEGEEAYRRALVALIDLPAHKRNVPATVALEEKIRVALARLIADS